MHFLATRIKQVHSTDIPSKLLVYIFQREEKMISLIVEHFY
jgi:hypothetical protein